MKYLQAVIQSLNVKELPNGEILYKFSDFYDAIKKICEEDIETDDCIITPYYIFEERRLELYEYELNIRLVDKYDFEQYLMSKTGKIKADDISKDVICLHRNCYYEILKTEGKISAKKIGKYIEYLYNNNNLKNQVQKMFGRFDTQNLMFEFY